MTARRGAGRLGCLLGALVLVTAIYFGVNIGEVFLRYYRIRDAMQQEARFADVRPDSAIRNRLRATADSLGLPEDAGRVSIQRTRNSITITSSYAELVELPLFVREFRFTPRIERTF
ncbi:MAG TPA: hypothetical protein VLE53_02255 [Gemmatimonadaceae bacterium]|nr:hypothetical protein [Gemmatimonadaceae bacterium]